MILERLFVQEYVGITKLFVESVFHLFHALRYSVQVRIPRWTTARSSKQGKLEQVPIHLPRITIAAFAFLSGHVLLLCL
jgi:hypothetical protein